jgi:GTP pyrophosphokinase
MPPENTKPVLLLSIRVGIYLLENKYSEDIVLAGFLHDILEDTNIAPVEIQNIFGKNVLELITANTKNTSIVDKQKEEKN